MRFVLHCSKTFGNPHSQVLPPQEAAVLPGDDVHGEQAKDD
jgi:hypothetical protein